MQKVRVSEQRHKDGRSICEINHQLVLCADNLYDPIVRVNHETSPEVDAPYCIPDHCNKRL